MRLSGIPLDRPLELPDGPFIILYALYCSFVDQISNREPRIYMQKDSIKLDLRCLEDESFFIEQIKALYISHTSRERL